MITKFFRLKRLTVFLLIFQLSPIPILAQTIDQEIAVGDALRITVLGNDELSRVVIVDERGTIDYPFVQNMPVTGMSLDQLQNIITYNLAKYISTPYVIISKAELYTININVLGQVKAPGNYMASNNTTLQGAIALAGGPTEYADLRQVVIRRVVGDAERRIEVDLERLLFQTDMAKMPVLEDGDMVIVPGLRGESKVTIIGQVNKPGSYVVPYGANVWDMILMAGGAAEGAKLKEVRHIHKSSERMVEEEVDLTKFLKSGRIDDIPKVAQGDVIIVDKKLLTWASFMRYVGNLTMILTALHWFTQIQRWR